MSTSETRSPKLPPAWFVHTAWRVHRALYRLSGGRFLWTTSDKRRLGGDADRDGGIVILPRVPDRRFITCARPAVSGQSVLSRQRGA
jgi:hypothetical protein